MSKFYKAEDVTKAIEGLCDDMHAMNDLDQASGVTSALWLIESLPTIDIVHCKDCEHYEDNYCSKRDELIEPNEWCSFGERIDNE